MDKQTIKERSEKAISQMKTQIENLFHMCKENKKVVIICTIFCVVIIGAVIGIQFAEKKDNVAPTGALEETVDGEEATITVPEEALEKDAYPELNNLIKQYYQALVDGDMDTIHSIKSYTDLQEEIRIVKKSEYVEGYPSITVYTKKGPEEGSYIAYVNYEVKFLNIEGTAPGLNTLYICTDENGNYYINSGDLEESTVEYLKSISAQNDVIDLFNTVQVQYNEIKTENEQLSAFLDELPNLLAESVSVAMAEAEEANAPAEPEEEEPVIVTVVKTVKATDVVNVRSSDSIEADKIGKTKKDQVMELLEEKVNGWSKVIFEGKEGFIKSEYLEPEETETVVNNPTTGNPSETITDAQQTQEEQSQETSKKGTLADTVNVRKTASTEGEKLGKLTKGSTVEILEEMSNGWTKIKYNDAEAYVKSDYVE